MIYRSHDLQGFTALGVVEDTLRSSNPVEIARYVGTRTVYNFQEITEFCKKQTLAIRFRYAKGLRPELKIRNAEGATLLNGVPQSITKLKEEAVEWIQKKIEM